jgi:hypothetical protein
MEQRLSAGDEAAKASAAAVQAELGRKGEWQGVGVPALDRLGPVRSKMNSLKID